MSSQTTPKTSITYLFLAFAAYSTVLGYTGSVDSILRQDGWSQTHLGFLALLALPWALKFMWAGWLDRTPPHSRFIGQNLQGWLIVMQVLQIALFIGMAFHRPNWANQLDFMLFIGSFLLLNVTSASIEIAANGLAVRQKQLGYHHINSWQMGGYELGRILGGAGFLLIAGYSTTSPHHIDDNAWRNAFLFLAALSTLTLLPKFWLSIDSNYQPSDDASLSQTTFWQRIRDFGTSFKAFWQRPQWGVWLIFLMCYKSSEIFGSSVYKPMLVDHGIQIHQIGGLTAVGAIAAIFGAISGAYWVNRLNTIKALRLAYVFQGTGLLGYALVYYLLEHHSGASLTMITAMEAYEQFCSAQATTVLLSALMSASRQEHAALDFSIQHSILIVSAGLLRVFAGVVVDNIGYLAFYQVSMIMMVLFGLVIWVSSKAHPHLLISNPERQ